MDLENPQRVVDENRLTSVAFFMFFQGPFGWSSVVVGTVGR